jgi:hypothetical protein
LHESPGTVAPQERACPIAGTVRVRGNPVQCQELTEPEAALPTHALSLRQ